MCLREGRLSRTFGSAVMERSRCDTVGTADRSKEVFSASLSQRQLRSSAFKVINILPLDDDDGLEFADASRDNV